jgi:hypothetical protein
MTQDAIQISPGPRFRIALILAIIADALQIVVFPLFVEGAVLPSWLALGVPPFLLGQARPRSRFGTFLDVGGR